MPYATKAFVANPKGFLADNIIVPHHSNIGVDQASANMHSLCLVLGGAKGKKSGADIPVWLLKKHGETDPADEAFDAYWCPYNQGETFDCMLGNTALFMFTATMDGCSFGVGSQNKGACRVAHANTAKHVRPLQAAGLTVDQLRSEQRKTQRNMLHMTFGGYDKVSLIEPIDYRMDSDGQMDLVSTTIGMHAKDENWQFFTQRYWKSGSTYFLRDLKRQL